MKRLKSLQHTKNITKAKKHFLAFKSAQKDLLILEVFSSLKHLIKSALKTVI